MRTGNWLGIILVIGMAGCSTGSLPKASSISGIVALPTDQCSQAIVVLCDAASGIPLDRTGQPFTENKKLSYPFELWQTRPDSAGHFAFTNLPPGNYRVVAQSWHRAQPITNIFDVNGETIHLLGSRNVSVPSRAARRIKLESPGKKSGQFDQDFPNDGGLLLIGTEPTLGDPAIGFLGWGTNFTAHVIGINVMPGGRSMIHGLPEKTVHAAIFANDNNPGFGAMTIQAEAKQPWRMPIVAPWSDGHHEPPAHLLWLVDLIEKEKWTLPQLIGFDPKQERSDKNAMEMQRRINTKLRPILNNEVRLPNGKTARVADILAANSYISLRKLPRHRAKP